MSATDRSLMRETLEACPGMGQGTRLLRVTLKCSEINVASTPTTLWTTAQPGSALWMGKLLGILITAPKAALL